ncbi:DUF1353 domain-containing protein [Jiella endophytica]|uniref:DUF1353 domain-containing protein n=1 Tax=Jiella endophytica TaxID=2558362 RepID=UPI001430F18B|nr:DUF1353 domain-containing protein [Jiella endophytica]
MSAYTDWEGEFLLEDGRYRATLPLPWDVGCKGSGVSVTVPAEFRHNVSVPAPLRWAFPPDEPEFQRGARLHDFLLAAGWSPPEAAGVFHAALKADGVSSWRRLCMFVGVALWHWR